jgi:hypothetical protein
MEFANNCKIETLEQKLKIIINNNNACNAITVLYFNNNTSNQTINLNFNKHS